MKIIEYLLLIATYELVKAGLNKIFGPQTFYMMNEGTIPIEFKTTTVFHKWQTVRICKKMGWFLVSARSVNYIFKTEETE